MSWSFSSFVCSVKLFALIMNALLPKLSNNKILHAGFEMPAADTVSYSFLVAIISESTSLWAKK